MSSPGRTLIEIDPTDLGLAWLVPRTFFFAVEIGIMMMSSWSWPHELWPLRSSMPITVKGTFLIRMIWPVGSASPKRLSAVVWPTRATFVAPSTSSTLICRPSTAGQSRASK